MAREILNLLGVALDAAPAQARVALVDPHQVAALAPRYEHTISVAGYPTGRHHTLIKASEARLAFQSGAAEIWVSVDDTITDFNAHLAELVAVREACPAPVRLGLIVPLGEIGPIVVKAAGVAGFDLVVAAQPLLFDAPLPVDNFPYPQA